MNHTPLTKDIKLKLLESAELGIEHVSKSVDVIRSLIKKVKFITNFTTKNEFSIE